MGFHAKVGILTLGLTAAAAWGQSYTEWDVEVSEATSVTSNGSTVAGFSRGPTTWTAGGGFVSYAAVRDGFRLSYATGVAEDGHTISGYALTEPINNFPYYRAFWATAPGEFQYIEPPRGYRSTTSVGLSGDGMRMAVNVGNRDLGVTQAAIWSPGGGLVTLGFGPGQFYSNAHAISRDGSTVVGYSDGGESTGFVWTEAMGMRVLHGVAGSINGAMANGVNFDGSLIVGESYTAEGPVATLWRDGIATALASPLSQATSISDDGAVVLGSIGFNGDAAIFQNGSATLLSDYLRSIGLALPDGWRGYRPTVSGDGRTIVGSCTDLAHPSGVGFVAVIPAPGGAFFLCSSGVTVVGRRRR